MKDVVDVFVSHSHNDEDLAKGLVQQLRAWNISVYADFDDMALSDLPDAALAERLAEKLRGCRLFIFAFSEEASKSKWMPWELGLAHGIIGRVVLWPFTEKALEAKATQEYLHLYEALKPTTAKARLEEILAIARNAAIRPADLKMMQDLANITLRKQPEFGNPGVAIEFTSLGPAQLLFEWLSALSKGASSKPNEP